MPVDMLEMLDQANVPFYDGKVLLKKDRIRVFRCTTYRLFNC